MGLGRQYLSAIGLLALCVPFGHKVQATEPADKAAVFALPSGLEVEFNEMIWNEMGDGLTYRFRFVVEKLAETELSDEDRVTDMKYLCEEFALPRVPKTGPKPSSIVVSMANKKGDFGVYNNDIVEFFEYYKIADNACAWELY